MNVKKKPYLDLIKAAVESEPNHFQFYENVSQGTPLSPVFSSSDELKTWLIAEGYSEKAVTRFIELRHVPSMIMANGKIYENIHGLDIE